MLSLIELQSKKVEAKRKKYDKDEMDAYLELVFENYRQLLENNKTLEAERNELSQKVKKLSDGVQYYRSIETTLQKALILAEKTSKETKDAALLKAEAIEKDANKKAALPAHKPAHGCGNTPQPPLWPETKHGKSLLFQASSPPCLYNGTNGFQ